MTNYATLTEHVGASEDEISGCRVRWQISHKFKAYDFGKYHRNLLTEHDRLSLNASDTPTNDTKSIDHGRVRVSANNGIGVEDTVLLKDYPGEPLKIHLMYDTVSRWDDSEVLEGFLTPLEEGKALFVPVEFDLFIAVLGILCPGDVNLNGVIDNKVNLTEWVDFRRITTELFHSCTHGSQIDDGRHTCKVLQENSGRLEGNLKVLL